MATHHKDATFQEFIMHRALRLDPHDLGEEKIKKEAEGNIKGLIKGVRFLLTIIRTPAGSSL